MASLTTIGNELYTGERSLPVVGKRKLWFMVAAIVAVSITANPTSTRAVSPAM